jgi:hypothetical protein
MLPQNFPVLSSFYGYNRKTFIFMHVFLVITDTIAMPPVRSTENDEAIIPGSGVKKPAVKAGLLCVASGLAAL